MRSRRPTVDRNLVDPIVPRSRVLLPGKEEGAVLLREAEDVRQSRPVSRFRGKPSLHQVENCPIVLMAVGEQVSIFEDLNSCCLGFKREEDPSVSALANLYGSQIHGSE